MRTAMWEDNPASLCAFAACGIQLTGDYEMAYIPTLGKRVRMLAVRKIL